MASHMDAWICMVFLVCMCTGAFSQPLVPAVFVFGDSTVDPGNNNDIPTIIKANFLPYGKDFPGHKATGRFTDGKLITDLVANLSGVTDQIPAYLDPEFQGPIIAKGASFASSASGYYWETAKAVNSLPLETQLEMFRSYKSKLVDEVGESTASMLFRKGLFCLSTGTVDYMNYYQTLRLQKMYTIDQFQDMVFQSFNTFLQAIIEEGATKIMVTGIPAFGCLPSMITLYNLVENKCLDRYNDVAVAHNQRLRQTIDAIKPTIPWIKITYIDIYDTFLDMVINPSTYGIEEVRRGCCGSGYLEATYFCNTKTIICEDPSKYLFFDSLHPTSYAYSVLAKVVYKQALVLL